VSTLALAIKAILSAPRALKALDQSSDLQARFDAAMAQVGRDTTQVSFAIARAFVAHATGREPSSEEVTAFLDHAMGDPAFPHRAYRLLGEVRKAASWRRRVFLASVLYGLPFSPLPDDERDRVDMAVERMMPADADLLTTIRDKDLAERADRTDAMNAIFGTSNCVVLLRSGELRIATAAEWNPSHQRSWSPFSDEVTDDPRFSADRAALASLEALGCLELGPDVMRIRDWRVHQKTITALGNLVLRALDDVRPGFAAQQVG
jgi:hypothetical protein